jgi:hypothetical protein
MGRNTAFRQMGCEIGTAVMISTRLAPSGTLASRRAHLGSLSMSHLRLALLLLSIVSALQAAPAAASIYHIDYGATIDAGSGLAHVSIKLSSRRDLPSRLDFAIDPGRYTNFEAAGHVERRERHLIWEPPADGGTLRYDFRIDNKRRDGMYDSLITKDWAILRADRMVPPVSVTAPKGAKSHARLRFELPDGWSIITPFPAAEPGVLRIAEPDRRFDRPTGWMLAGRIGTRSEVTTGIETIVAAPLGGDARRQDTLAFLNWNLPEIAAIFPGFPKRLLVVRAGDPMFRGGLSGPSSLFLHLDRPLISENRTSTLLHELVHVATGLRGDDESDWIVEGIAEYYSIETLRRSGGISQVRYQETLSRLARWSKQSTTLFKKQSSGATTAQAVLVFAAADAEIRRLTDGKHSLDDVAARLATDRGEVSLARLQAVAAEVAGQPLQSLERKRLPGGT